MTSSWRLTSEPAAAKSAAYSTKPRTKKTENAARIPGVSPDGSSTPADSPEHERGDLPLGEERDDRGGDDGGELQEGRRADPEHLAGEELEGRGRGQDDLHHPAALLLGHALGDPVAVEDDGEEQEELEREDDRRVRLLLRERPGALLVLGWIGRLDRDRRRGEEGRLLLRRDSRPAEPVGDGDRGRRLAADHRDAARVALLGVDGEDGLPRGIALDVEERGELAVGDLRSARREVARAGHGECVLRCVRSAGAIALRVEERVERGHRVCPEVRPPRRRPRPRSHRG